MGMWRRKRGKEGRRKRRMLVKHLVCARHFRYFIPPIFPAPHCNNKIYVIIFISQMVKLKFKDVKLMCHVTQQCVADPGFKPISAWLQIVTHCSRTGDQGGWGPWGSKEGRRLAAKWTWEMRQTLGVHLTWWSCEVCRGKIEIHWLRARVGNPRADAGKRLALWNWWHQTYPRTGLASSRLRCRPLVLWPRPVMLQRMGQGLQTAGEVKWNLSG